MADTAVVIGAGMAGLCAAAALRGQGRDVLVVERDTLSDGPVPRRGVPQSHQLHNLLEAGQRALETLFPGYVGDLTEAGGIRARVATDTCVYELGQRMPARDLGLGIVSAPRALIEWVARRTLLDDGRVELRDSTTLDGASFGPDSVALTLRRRGHTDVLRSRLVVDASGSRTAFPGWLRRSGAELRSESVPVKSWYATVRFQRPSPDGPARFLMVFPTPPGTRGGLASPAGPDVLDVSLNGAGSDEPPRTIEAFRRYARSLEDTVIAEEIVGCKPLAEPTVFRRPTAVWNHYEETGCQTPPVLPIGDAFVTLNPLFGQGISVAATQAAGLASLDPDLPAGPLIARYLGPAGRAAALAWQLSFLLLDPPGGWAAAVVEPEAARRLGQLLAADEDLHRRYVSIWHMLSPASSLDTPDVLRDLAGQPPSRKGHSR